MVTHYEATFEITCKPLDNAGDFIFEGEAAEFGGVYPKVAQNRFGARRPTVPVDTQLSGPDSLPKACSATTLRPTREAGHKTLSFLRSERRWLPGAPGRRAGFLARR